MNRPHPIRRWMLARGYISKDIAARLGTDPTQFSRWLTGDRHPSPAVIGKMARELGVSARSITEWHNDARREQNAAVPTARSLRRQRTVLRDRAKGPPDGDW